MNYLTYWHRENRFSVTVEIDPRHGRDPLTLVQFAVEAKARAGRNARRGGGTGHDEYWCVVDVDEHLSLGEAMQLARQHGIRVAVSNPCFEVWLLMHFKDQTSWLNRYSAQREYRAISGATDKSLTSVLTSLLAQRFPMAKQRALRLTALHLGNGNPAIENPSSGVWELVDSITG